MDELLDIAQKGFSKTVTERKSPEQKEGGNAPGRGVQPQLHPVAFRAIQTELDAILIDTDQQYPWGILHPDYRTGIDIESIVYPSITHALYASVLVDPLHRRMLANTVSKKTMFEQWSSHYHNMLREIARVSIEKGYEALFSQQSEFVVSQLETLSPGEIVFLYNDINIGLLISDNYAGKMLQRIRSKSLPRLSLEREKVVNISIDHPLSMFHQLQRPIVIDKLSFDSIIQYFIYNRFLVFLKGNSAEAYRRLKDPSEMDLKKTDNAIHENYIQTTLNTTLKRALELTFKDLNNRRLLVSSPALYIRTDGPLFIYIDTELNKWLNREKQQSKIRPYDILDGSSIFDSDMDSYMLSWITRRTRHVLATIDTLFIRYIQTDFIFSDILQMLFERLYIQCGIVRPNTIVGDIHPSFIQMLKRQCDKSLWTRLTAIENGGLYNVYLLWTYIVFIAHDVVTSKQSKTYEDYIKGIQQSDKVLDLSTVYQCVRNIVVALHQLSSRYGQNVTFQQKELNALKELLDTDIRAPNKKPPTEHLSTIRRDLQTYLPGLERDQLRVVSESVDRIVADLVSNLSSLTPSTLSRIYFYS